jgi:chemotaxis protein methyltransferase CheR
MSPRAYQRISRLVYDTTRILLPPGKEEMVRSRLLRRVRATGSDSFDAYVDLVATPAGVDEARLLLDLLTTNKTSFWRESDHFEWVRAVVLPAIREGMLPRTLWSAGCSSGEEPYTLAALAAATGASESIRILATDYSLRALETARRGCYSAESLEEVPMEIRRTLMAASGAASGAAAGRRVPGPWQVAPPVRHHVHFAPLNLMAPWPMRGPFATIFCRNVMIYFDKATQQDLVARFSTLLAPGGYLCIGHAESLHGIAGDLTYVQPAIYRKTPVRT